MARSRHSLPDWLPRAVIFDMDGTMFDSESVDRDVWREAISRRGLPFDDDFCRSLIGLRELETDAAFIARYGEDFDIRALRADVAVLWDEVMHANGLPVKPGLLELLDLIDRIGIAKAVATSTVRTRANVRLGSLLGRFPIIVCGDEVAYAKPAPDLYLEAAARLRLPAHECLAIEDSPVGMTAARRAGMHVIVVPDLIDSPEDARYVCTSLHDVTAWLSGRIFATHNVASAGGQEDSEL